MLQPLFRILFQTRITEQDRTVSSYFGNTEQSKRVFFHVQYCTRCQIINILVQTRLNKMLEDHKSYSLLYTRHTLGP